MENLEKENKKLKKQIKELKQLLSEREAEEPIILNKVLESTNQGILVTNQENEVVYYNDEFIHLLELDKKIKEIKFKQVISKSGFQKVCSNKELNKIVYQITENLQSEKGSFKFKEGKIVEYNTIQYLVENISQGKIWYFKDSTETKKNEEQLRECEAKLKALFENAKYAIGVSYKGITTMINTACLEMFGYSKEDNLVGTSFLDLVAPDERNKIIEYDKLRSAGKYVPSIYETKGLRKNGAEFDLLATITTYEINGKISTIGFFRDITEQKLAEKALKESEEQYRSIFENSSSAVLILDLGMNIKDANPRACELYQYSKQELCKLKIFDITTAESFGLDKPEIFEVPKKDEPVEFEAIDIKKDGSKIKTLIKMTPFIFGGKKHILHIINDITVQKETEFELYKYRKHLEDLVEERTSELIKSEAELKNISERLSLAIKSANIGIWELDIVDNELIWDDRMYELYGITNPDDVSTYECWKKNVHPEDLQAMDTYVQEAIEGKKELDAEFRVIWPDGSLKYIRAFGLTQRDANGIAIRLTGMNYDITEQKQAEKDLRESEDKFKSLFQFAPVGAAIVNYQGEVISTNNSFQKMIGYTAEELSSMHINDFTHPDDTEFGWKHFQELVGDKGKPYSIQKRYIHKNGHIVWVNLNVTPIQLKINNTSAIIGMVSDISDHKEAEEKIKEALQKEKELNELKTNFISTVSHEFRTPLTSLLSSTELLEKFGRQWSQEDYSELTNRMVQSIDHLTDMLEDVLTISRADTGKIKFAPVKVNLKKLAALLVEEIKLIAEENHIINYEFKLKSYIHILDEKLLKIIISNLLTNAVKYSPEGGYINFIISKEKDNIKIVVEDNGIGIPPEHLKHLFEPFSRADNVGSIQGTGLGMSIVKRAVELHSGKIVCKSETGKGTKFTIRIPIVKIN